MGFVFSTAHVIYDVGVGGYLDVEEQRGAQL